MLQLPSPPHPPLPDEVPPMVTQVRWLHCLFPGPLACVICTLVLVAYQFCACALDLGNVLFCFLR